MNKSELYQTRLESVFINKGYVENAEEDCNYEKYLLEMLNASSWFQEKYGAGFHAPESESNGECDADDGRYAIDFKLFASTTMMQASNLHSLSIVKVAEGAHFIGPSKQQGSIQYTRFPQAFRGETIEHLLEIEKSAGRKQGVEKDIRNLMALLRKEKNLLFFFPYLFRFEIPGEKNEDDKDIIECITQDIGVLFKYRKDQYPQYDSYFVLIRHECFIICLWEDDHFRIVDKVSVWKSEAFKKLTEYSQEQFKGKDIVLERINKKRIQEGKPPKLNPEW